MIDGGAYALHLSVRRRIEVAVGRWGRLVLRRGRYLYVGSAKRALAARAARHSRLAESRTGRLHWHIDYLLTHSEVRLVRAELLPGADECRVSATVAAWPGVEVPAQGFGASDCRSGCAAHLYRLPGTFPGRVAVSCASISVGALSCP